MSNQINFITECRMPAVVIEKQLDIHLNRMLKSHRHTNLMNALKSFPEKDRILEKTLQFLISTDQLITSQVSHLTDARQILDSLTELMGNLPRLNDNESKNQLDTNWTRIKCSAMNIEQLLWTLSINREHLKYLAKSYPIPANYQRSVVVNVLETQPDDDEHSNIEENPKDAEQIVNLRELIQKIVPECDELIDICKLIRETMALQLRTIYSNVNIVSMN